MAPFSYIGDFGSVSFFLFCTFTVVCVLCAPRTWRGLLILAASMVVLANTLSTLALIAYAGLLPVVYALGIASQPGRRFRRISFYTGVVLLLGVFLTMRLVPWGLTSATEGSSALTPLPVLLGYSYFLFRALNFLIASSTASIERPRPLPYLNLMLFFPSFTAGPVTRYNEQADTLARPERPGSGMLIEGVHRILNGLIKKTVFVPILAQFSLNSFGSPDEISGVAVAWLATICFYLYLYLDFSAYSDIAIGLGLALGCRLPENFNYPFLGTNLLLFWESWHMSLTQWIRDHVFVPLTWKLTNTANTGDLQRNQVRARSVGYLVTMTLFGIWHGFTWAFVAFGLIHGIGLALTRVLMDARRNHLSSTLNEHIDNKLAIKVASAILVNVFVALTLIFFRYNVSESCDLFRYLFTGLRP